MQRKIFRLHFIVILFLSLLLSISCDNVKNYTITFITDTDTVIEPITATEGEAIFAPTNPTREGYRFDGWLYNDEPFSFGIMPNSNIELTAKWSKYYQISFHTGEGTSLQSLSIAEGDVISFDLEPELAHYKFAGWSYLDSDFDLTIMPSANITLVAQWIPASTITFEARVYDRYLEEYVDLELDELVEVAGESISAPDIPEYLEYKFVSWQLDGVDFSFDTMPDEDVTLTANWLQLSNLPTLFIDLYDNSNNPIPIENITREFYVNSKISLENTDLEFEINSVDALFKGRGNGSWIDSGEKKGYRIKFDDGQSVLGSAVSKHWVILAGANFDDITMYRNKLAFNMADEVFTNIDYVTSAEWVDVYFNGEYHGVYLICEHLRVDEDRVDIESEYGVLDTGYLIEYDYYAKGINGVDYFTVPGMKYPFSMKSPSPEDYLENGLTIGQYREQVDFIRTMVVNMVNAAMDNDLATFAEYADVDSFVDMYILHELFKNIDTGYSSFFIYRHPGGKLTAGPPWDFDATCGSTPTRGNGSPNGIYVGLGVKAFSSRTANELLISLYGNQDFKDVVIERWTIISPNIQAFIDKTLTDEMIEEYQFAIGRNFVRWPTPQGFGSPISQEDAEANWANNIVILRQWMTDRINWLSTEWSNE